MTPEGFKLLAVAVAARCANGSGTVHGLNDRGWTPTPPKVTCEGCQEFSPGHRHPREKQIECPAWEQHVTVARGRGRKRRVLR